MLSTVDDQEALNDAFLDVVNTNFYGDTPILNFQNGVDREPNATHGGEIWMLDLVNLDEASDGGEPVRVLKELNYGTLAYVVWVK